jgi:small subunit ribosomal protein S9
MADQLAYTATGKRKCAVARVILIPGKGKITVNKSDAEKYFPRESCKVIIKQPLLLADVADKYDIRVNVRGGGKSGQAGAIKHGISRALLKVDDQFRPILKKAGCLTRDARIKERKKYGQKGARARFQFSKR